MEEGSSHQSRLGGEKGRLTLWGPYDCLPLYLGGIVEGIEFVGQPQHEAVVVVDHAEEALETDLIGGHGEVAHCLDLDSRGTMLEVVIRCPR